VIDKFVAIASQHPCLPLYAHCVIYATSNYTSWPKLQAT